MYRILTGVITLLLMALPLSSEVVTIGSGAILNQSLPWEPFADYNYTQQLFYPSEIGSQGVISSIAFNYRVQSASYFEGNRMLKVWMGHSASDSLQDWIPLGELVLVFDGVLNLGNYSTALPGTGWLTIPLDTAFDYNGSEQLVLAIDENSPNSGTTADDFYCSASGQTRAIRFNSETINPDPQAPPQSGFHLMQKFSNLRLDIQQITYIPYSPMPIHQAINVPLDSAFGWESDAQTYDFYLGPYLDSMSLMASGLTSSQWTPSEPFALLQNYCWQVIAHLGNEQFPSPIWTFTTAGEALYPPQNLNGYYDGTAVRLNWQAPLQGTVDHYQVWRNGQFLCDLLGLAHADFAVLPGVYTYTVKAVNHLNQISEASNQISVSVPIPNSDLIISEGFEGYAGFSQTLRDWQLQDLDGSATWSFDAVDFPGESDPHSWIVFQPGQTTPPLQVFSPWEGSAVLASISATSPPNNDWLISPQINLGTNPSLSFYARSHTADFGLERLRILISSDPAPSSFIPLHSNPWLEVPATWTEFGADLTAWQHQNVYLAFNCVSWDALALYIDAIEIRGEGGSGNSDEAFVTDAFKLYPNPSRGDFKLASAPGQSFDLEIYDLRGRKIQSYKNLRGFDSKESDLKLASGVYLLKIASGAKSLIQKLLILK